MTNIDIQAYVNSLEKKKRKDTIDNIGYLLLPFERWAESQGYSLSGIDDEEVTEYCDFKISEGDWIEESANQFITHIKKYYKWRAARIEVGVTPDEIKATLQERQRAERIIDLNRYVTQEREKKRGMSVEDIATLFEITKDTKPDYAQTVPLFYFGWRRKEQASLDPTNHRRGITELATAKIDFNKRMIRLMTGKRYVLRTLFFNKRIGRLLKEGREKGYFRIEDDIREINWVLEEYDKDMGTHLYPKMGRESFNTHMRPILRDDVLLKKILGHSITKSDMTARYAGWDEEIKEAMLNKHYLKGII